jgi:hypothetical protein
MNSIVGQTGVFSHCVFSMLLFVAFSGPSSQGKAVGGNDCRYSHTPYCIFNQRMEFYGSSTVYVPIFISKDGNLPYGSAYSDPRGFPAYQKGDIIDAEHTQSRMLRQPRYTTGHLGDVPNLSPHCYGHMVGAVLV